MITKMILLKDILLLFLLLLLQRNRISRMNTHAATHTQSHTHDQQYAVVHPVSPRER